MKIINRGSYLAIAIVLALGCFIFILFQPIRSALTMPNSAIRSSERAEIAQKPDLGQHFQELEVEGSILIYDLNSDRGASHFLIKQKYLNSYLHL
ncbi:hypothetical protein NIES593_12610, partial [Hydrococcus rivularis NIES-593]